MRKLAAGFVALLLAVPLAAHARAAVTPTAGVAKGTREVVAVPTPWGPPNPYYERLTKVQVGARLVVGSRAYQVIAVSPELDFDLTTRVNYCLKPCRPELMNNAVFAGTSPAGAFQATCLSYHGYYGPGYDSDRLRNLHCTATVGPNSGALAFAFSVEFANTEPGVYGDASPPQPFVGAVQDISD